ncbi:MULTISPECIES: DUF3883 domain-containing protein [unclassified Mesorhizobium]|uniref:DUF3883 domain-containing protein n=1 Tax=unclassified Mesorhizobium TaxID=325217 RepID=UPI00333DC9F1
MVDMVSEGIGDRNHLISAIQAAHSATRNRGSNTIDMLIEIGVLLVAADGALTVAPDMKCPADSFVAVRDALLRSYLGLLTDFTTGSLFQIDSRDQTLMVNPVQLPGRDRCYPYALLEFEILCRGASGEPFWSIQKAVVPAFMQFLLAANERPPRRAFPLAALKAMKSAQEQAGRRAEEWTVSFERRRLNGHPFVRMVRSLSDDDAGAGFDIMSFENPQTLLHDRFIEVKSYDDEYSFFWSEGEMETARRLGMSYWLYLVDRRAIGFGDYTPEMIPDPINFFVERDPIGWLVNTQGMKFTRMPGHRSDGRATP